MLTPNEIRKITFSKSKVGGYKPAEVEEFLSDIAKDMQTVIKEKDELLNKLTILANKIEEYRSEEDNIRIALVSAQQLGDKMTKEAKQNSESIMAEALEKAQTLVGDAKQNSENMIAAAEKKAKELVDAAEKKANSVLDIIKSETRREERVLEEMKRQVGAFKTDIMNKYKNHIEQLTKLPDYAEPEPDPLPEEKEEPVKKQAAEEVTDEQILQDVASEPAKAPYIVIQSVEEDHEDHEIKNASVLDSQLGFEDALEKSEIISYETDETDPDIHDEAEAEDYDFKKEKMFQSGFNVNVNAADETSYKRKDFTNFGPDYNIKDDVENEEGFRFFSHRRK